MLLNQSYSVWLMVTKAVSTGIVILVQQPEAKAMIALISVYLFLDYFSMVDDRLVY